MANSTRVCALVAIVIGITTACADSKAPVHTSLHPADWVDSSPHRSEYVIVNGVRLNYLDWGGTKPVLVVVHGEGDSPHLFDDLASSLRDDYHLIAYARRGHGHSDAPTGPYDQGTLVEDLHQLLDHLGIARASLLAWSMGALETTEFAVRYPDRVQGLIYLEAAYDWSDPTFQNSVFPVGDPAPSDLRSLDAYRIWVRRSWFGDTPWTPGLEAYLRDIVRLKPDGQVEPVPSGAIYAALQSSILASRQDYKKVRAPVLALYAESFFPVGADTPEQTRARRDWESKVMDPFRQASIARLRRELPQVIVREYPGTAHVTIGVLAQDAVTAEIRGFLQRVAH
jgi:pimeloyl-ACP methyl ester carboxylesterase